MTTVRTFAPSHLVAKGNGVEEVRFIFRSIISKPLNNEITSYGYIQFSVHWRNLILQ
jgi:hypothetical protein